MDRAAGLLDDTDGDVDADSWRTRTRCGCGRSTRSRHSSRDAIRSNTGFVITPEPILTAATATPGTTVTVGQPVALEATATGGGVPVEYQF